MKRILPLILALVVILASASALGEASGFPGVWLSVGYFGKAVNYTLFIIEEDGTVYYSFCTFRDGAAAIDEQIAGTWTSTESGIRIDLGGSTADGNYRIDEDGYLRGPFGQYYSRVWE